MTASQAAAELPSKPTPVQVKRAAKPEPPAEPRAKAQPAKKPEPAATAERPRPPAPKPHAASRAKPEPKAEKNQARRAAEPEPPALLQSPKRLDASKAKPSAKTQAAEKLEGQDRRPVKAAAAAPTPDRSTPVASVDRDAAAAAAIADVEPTPPGKPLRARRGLGSLGKQAFNRTAPALQLLPRPHLPPATTPARPAGAMEQAGDAASLIAQARSLAGGPSGQAGRHKDPVAFLRDELLALLALIEEPPEPPPSPHGSG